ncbi:patatin-like phospholipase family protein [Roseococcus sp. SYP-B2431]|uniref:patatin-like phospholipase family protein n=1 Tax=Roseococcus sp. SYP-B2431 TaxID=2496640 RepID=UPI00103B2237|nr:patatin-like phospholipase family protein [Roseococcus sp. SYP-B2431]TCH98318.1 patatin-like phospholipase family protein [Roseococcus sp. SYP-B2431]
MSTSASRTELPNPLRALVLSGGLALGAFEAGACAAYEEAGERGPDWISGSSVGAINAAIFAGAPPGRGAERLRSFWQGLATDPAPFATYMLGPPPAVGAWRRAYNLAGAMQSMLMGHPGLFRPRAASPFGIGQAPAVFDLEPLERRLAAAVDFERLNGGPCRVSITATDVVSGERVVFDTAEGARITPRHLVASGALMPVFAPVEVEGRLLGDGGLSVNAPLDLVLDAPRAGALDCVVVELFAPAGSRPRSLGASMSRAADLVFGNQTRRLLESRGKEQRLRRAIARLAERLPEAEREDAELAALLAQAEGGGPATVVCLGYRAGLDEAGLGAPFDFTPATIKDRWEAGADGMRLALGKLRSDPAGEAPDEAFRIHTVDVQPGGR